MSWIDGMNRRYWRVDYLKPNCHSHTMMDISDIEV